MSSTWGDAQGTEKPDSSPSPLIPASPWMWPLPLPGAQLLPELCSHRGGLDPGQWWLVGCGGGCSPDSARWCSCSELGLRPQAPCGQRCDLPAVQVRAEQHLSFACVCAYMCTCVHTRVGAHMCTCVCAQCRKQGWMKCALLLT